MVQFHKQNIQCVPDLYLNRSLRLSLDSTFIRFTKKKETLFKILNNL